MALLSSETFTGSNGSAWPSQWTIQGSVSGYTATIQSNQGQLGAAATGTYSMARANLTGVPVTTGDSEITGTVVGTVSAVEQYVIIGLNGSGATPTSTIPTDGVYLQLNYNATASSSSLKLFNGATQLGTTVTMTLTGTTVYGFRLRHVGTTVYARAWAASGTEPSTWQITQTLGTNLTGYPCLLTVNGGNATQRLFNFDNITVSTPVTPTIARHAVGTAATGSATTSLSVAWPTNSVNDVAILSVASTTTATTPAGWTLVASDTTPTGAHLYIFWQAITSIKSGSVTVTLTSGNHRGQITTYSGVSPTTAPASGFAITHAASASTAVSTSSVAFASYFGIMIVASAAAPTIAGETSDAGLGWTPAEALDSAGSTLPSLAVIDGAVPGGGTGSLSGTLSSSVLWSAFALSPASPAVTAPVASFTATPLTGAASLAVNFTDTSTNSPTSWSWTFGDGATSTSQSPSHTYTSPGTYVVTLVAINNAGESTVTQNNYVTATGSAVTLPYTETWTGSNGAGWPTAWTPAIFLGTGGSSTIQNNAGRLLAGSTSSSWMRALLSAMPVISDTEVVVSFTIGGQVASNFNFHINSDNSQLSSSPGEMPNNGYTFNFNIATTAGGGSFDIWKVVNGVYTEIYATTGITLAAGTLYTIRFQRYTNLIRFRLWQASGSEPTTWTASATDPNTMVQAGQVVLTVGNSATQYIDFDNLTVSVPNTPVASFTATPTTGAAPLAVTFTDTSTNLPTSWSWDFGDGGTSTVQNPSYSYATAGTYTATLTATNSVGNSTSTTTITVSAPSLLSIQSWDGGTGAADGVAITNANTNGAGNTPIATPNTSNATFSATQAHAGLLSASWYSPASASLFSDTLLPTAVPVGTRAALREYFYFTSFPTLMALIAVRASSAVQFTVSVDATGHLILKNASGTAVWTSSSVLATNTWLRVEVAYTVGPSATGSAQIAYYTTDSTTATEDSGLMTSLGLSSAATTTYRFGTSVTQPTAFTYYRDDWAFNASLTSGFIGPITQVPVASFTAAPTTGTAPLAVTFTDTSTNAPTSWSWDFGDGGTSTSQNPSYTYSAGGTYTVTLTATNLAGSNTSIQTNLITTSLPPASVYLQSWDGGTGAADGVAITNANTNGAGNTPIATPNSGNATFSATQAHSATLSASWYSPASASLFSDTSIPATVPVGTRAALREYFYFTSFPTLMALIAVRYASGPQLTISVDATGHLNLNGASGSTLWTSTNVLATNTWLRIEAAYTIGTSTTGSVQIAYYAADNATATEDSGLLTGVGLSSTATTTYRFGTSVTQSTAFTYYRDDWAFNPAQSSGFIGPVAQVPFASFSATPTSGTAPLMVTFTDTSTNSPTSWSWSFGDGGTSTSQNPSYSYVAAGTYSVSLTATNSAGNGSVTQNNLISVSAASSTSTQNWDGGTGAANGVVISSSNTNGPGNTAISSVTGSGGTFTTAPVHSGTLGVQWSVPASTSLYADFPVTSQTGIRMAMREYIYFSSLPTVVAYVNSFRVSAGTLSMAAVVNGSGKYEFRGAANTSLWTATNTFPINQWVRIEFTATISSTANAGTAQVAYYLGDSMTAIEDSGLLTGLGLGTAAATIARIGGLATVGSAVLYYRDDLSFNSSLPSGYIGPSAIAPVASFSTSPTSGISPLVVTFTDTSANTPTSWSWDFGDGGTSTAQNPSHTYTGRGVYTVSLTATNTAGNNTVTMSKLIGVNSSTASQVFQNWDGGTGAGNGVTISTTNTNGPGNTALATTTIGSSATLTFSTEQTHSNSLSAKYTQSSGSSGITFSTISVTTTVGVRSVYRVYVYMSILPAATQWSFGNVYGGGSQVSGLFVNTSGTIGYGLSSAFDSGVTMPTNQWVRVEMGVTVGATAAQGYVDCAIFLNADSMIPTFASGPINTTTVGTTPVDTARIGGGTNAAARTWYLDDWAFDANMPSGYIGPSFPPSQGNVKTYTGTMFAPKPVKVWDGAGWIVKPLKRWDGTQWSETSY